MLYLLVSAAFLLLFVAALVDIIMRQEGQVRHLPKLVWVLLVVLLPFVGSVLWFAIGREYERSRPAPAPQRQQAPGSRVPHDVRPARTTEEQLAALEQEIEFYDNQARIKRLEAELEERRRKPES